MSISFIIFFCGPAVLALLAFALGIYLAVRVGTMTKGGQALAWFGMVFCGLVGFGIVGGYVWLFSGGLRWGC